MDIFNLMANAGPDFFYDPDFMATLESHMDFFKTHPRTTVIQINPEQSAIYDGDFYGYLTKVGIPAQYHWVIMRLNGMYSSTDFTSELTTLYVPDRDFIDQLRIIHKSTVAIAM